MEVENTSKDSQFKYVDELHDLGIEWYAGAPLINEDGYKIGSFCIADPETQDFTEKDRKLLRLLADESMDKIETKYKKQTIMEKLRSLF